MNKHWNTTCLYDFDVRYDQEKNRHESLNTDCVLEKKEDPLRQFYTGLYYQKCYHNTGRYKWINNDEHYVYEGKLYANDLHGYGRLVYPDNSSYEGLFLHNKRFGPGVVTYPDGLQDVGLWDGKYLIRLTQNIDLANHFLEYIPNIAKTAPGKLFLLKYKKNVPIIDENDPVASLVRRFKMNEADSQRLYSKCVRNHKSIFMNRSKFDMNFYTDPKELIVDVVDHFDENEEPVMGKINVTNLLAWNNEKIFFEIMKHTFKNRKYEKVISYKIRNVFLPNRRETFMSEGPIEEMCLKLLVACRNDDTVTISKLISDYDLCPDVSDCFGNTTIIYAAMANKINAIKTLVNLGANLNAVNDEGVSPLSLCILNYLAIKNEISEDNWETAFLNLLNDPNLLVNGKIWPTGSNSSISFGSEAKETITSNSSTTEPKKQKRKTKSRVARYSLINKQFIFKLIYSQPLRETVSKRVRNLHKKIKLSKLYRQSAKCDKKEALSIVMKTIQTLLDCGADANEHDVPFPPLISSLFSDNVEMVELILNANVEINKSTRADDGGLNPLHIVCAMDNTKNQAEIMELLIEHGADVEARTNISHWSEARDKILAGDPIEFGEDESGKTPFHVVAMRYDFEEDNENRIVDVAKMLVGNDADPNKQYLGHNVLSLATLRGNEGLMNYILSNYLSDPNGSLGYNMGTPLTMLTLKKYAKSLPPKKLESVMETLVKHNANPFNEVSNFEVNALEFAEFARDSKKKSTKGDVALNTLQKLSAAILRRYIDSRALHLIYKYLNYNEQNNRTTANTVVKYLNFEKAHRILQIFLDYKIVPPNFDICMKLLNFVFVRTAKGKLRIEFIDKPEIKKDESGDDHGNTSKKIQTQFEMSKTLVQIKDKDKVYILDFNRESDGFMNPYKESMPEIDQNHEKYIVCYGCLERINKTLQLCPSCNLVYFCSVKCNNEKNKSGEHPCKKISYIDETQESSVKSSSKSRTKKKKELHHNSLVDVDGNDDDDIYDDDFTSFTATSSRGDSESYSESSFGSKRAHKGKKAKKEKTNTRMKRKKGKGFKSRNKWNNSSIIRKRGKIVCPLSNSITSIIRKRRKKVCPSECKGKLIAIEFKESLKDVLKQMMSKTKPPELTHLKSAIWSHKLKQNVSLDKESIDLMLSVAKRVNLQLIPVLDSNPVFNPCNPFDYKFWQLFSPYCVFQNGDLFYRSDDCDFFYKLPLTRKHLFK